MDLAVELDVEELVTAVHGLAASVGQVNDAETAVAKGALPGGAHPRAFSVRAAVLQKTKRVV